MKHTIKEKGGFKYVESEGKGPNLLLLHGLFGSLSNFEGILSGLGTRYRVILPILPICDENIPRKESTLEGLLKFVMRFVDEMKLENLHVLGNSLGGHIALLYAFEKQDNVLSLVLTGSSGLFESAFGKGFPQRENYDFITAGVQGTFYNPNIATKELIDEVFETVNDRAKAIRIISTAKSAIRHNVEEDLQKIKVPCLIIWGKNDKITPQHVGEKFHALIAGSQFVLVDECGHAPMMEKPEEFNIFLTEFLDRISSL